MRTYDPVPLLFAITLFGPRNLTDYLTGYIAEMAGQPTEPHYTSMISPRDRGLETSYLPRRQYLEDHSRTRFCPRPGGTPVHVSTNLFKTSREKSLLRRIRRKASRHGNRGLGRVDGTSVLRHANKYL